MIWYNITIKIKKAVEKPNGKEAEAEAHTIHLLARKKSLVYRQKTDRQDIIINKQASGARRLLPTRADRKTRQLMQKCTD